MFNYKTIKPEKCLFYEVASLEELKKSKRLYFEIDSKAIVLFEVAGELYAIGDICTHDDGPLGDGALEGYVVTCPRHGAQFDVRDGKVLSLPAIIDIPAYPVRVVEGKIEIGVPIDE